MWIWSNTAKQYDERLYSVYSLQCVQQALLDLLTLQPHPRWLQCTTSRQTRPVEVVVVTIHTAGAAVSVPESASVHCTVTWLQVVVSVKCAKHHAIVVSAEWIACITRVPRHVQPVVVRLRQDYERTVLGVVPVHVVTWLHVNPQLIAAGQCQLTEQVVAKPVVTSRVVEADFILCPWTVKGVRPINFLLDHQWSAVVYRTFIHTSRVL